MKGSIEGAMFSMPLTDTTLRATSDRAALLSHLVGACRFNGIGAAQTCPAVNRGMDTRFPSDASSGLGASEAISWLGSCFGTIPCDMARTLTLPFEEVK